MSTFPIRSCKAHYDKYGNYINTFGENSDEALERYRRQANERHNWDRWHSKSYPVNCCLVMTVLAFVHLVNITLKHESS